MSLQDLQASGNWAARPCWRCSLCQSFFYIHIPLLFWLVSRAENKTNRQASADSLENKQIYRSGPELSEVDGLSDVSTNGKSVALFLTDSRFTGRLTSDGNIETSDGTIPIFLIIPILSKYHNSCYLLIFFIWLDI